MKTAITIALLALAAPALAGGHTGPDFDPDEILPLAADLDGFEVLETPDLSGPGPLALLQGLDIHFPLHPEEEGRPALRIEMAQHGALVAANVIETGWPDDSVSGQGFRVLMERSGGDAAPVWTVTGLGRVWVCSRGETRYTDGRCP